MVTALNNGARAILPVQEITEAIAALQQWPDALLAGERDGVRIGSNLTGGRPFDLGNSPREFTAASVSGKTIVMTTTNGTRALRSCLGAQRILAGSFLNMEATTTGINGSDTPKLLVICSGTLEEAAYEDVLGAGALCDRVWNQFEGKPKADSAYLARQIFLEAREDLMGAMARSRNAQRLLSQPDLGEDVAFCLRTDAIPVLAEMSQDGLIRRTS
jgi:2-phosphosulfolactate phosphatase